MRYASSKTHGSNLTLLPLIEPSKLKSTFSMSPVLRKLTIDRLSADGSDTLSLPKGVANMLI